MELLTADNALALLTLSLMEIVLGIDNVIFISILVGKLPAEQRELARKLGLGFAMATRLLLLFTITWIMRLTEPMFTLLEHAFSGRDLILIFGGLFLIGKSTHEIHSKVEAHEATESTRKVSSFWSAIIQIAILDIIFSLDSVITAVGMADHISIMAIAIVLSVLVMMVFAKSIGNFIDRHPTFKILALSFLLLIGVMLMIEGFGQHVEKAYIYSAIGFSLFVETINMRIRPNPTKAHS